MMGNNEKNEAIIKALKDEIENLKKKVAEQEETIDFLVLERDEESNEVYKLRLKLADAWNVTLPDNPSRIREVIRISRLNDEQKSYCDTVKGAQTNQESKNTEIMAENQLLSSKLREATRKITELVNERGQLKREIEDLNDNVINSLLAERDEVHEYTVEEKNGKSLQKARRN